MRIPPLLAYPAAAVAFAAVIGCGIGSGSTESSTSGTAASAKPSPVQAAMGTAVTLNSALFGTKTQITITLSGARTADREPGSFPSKPERGKYLVVAVTIAQVNGTYDVNPFNFKFVAKDGSVYEASFAAFPPGLQAVGLSAGQKTSGNIVFDVPTAALNGARIQVYGISVDYDQPAAYWTVGLTK